MVTSLESYRKASRMVPPPESNLAPWQLSIFRWIAACHDYALSALAVSFAATSEGRQARRD
jgi:hypothetical protein